MHGESQGSYTNLNAGLTKNKRKTFDYTFDRKSTVARANVEKMIDDALSTGKFREIDQLYVKLINATCRHINHSGPNGYPSKEDRCSVKKSVVDGEGTERKLKKWEKQGKKGPKPKALTKNVFSWISFARSSSSNANGKTSAGCTDLLTWIS